MYTYVNTLYVVHTNTPFSSHRCTYVEEKKKNCADCGHIWRGKWQRGGGLGKKQKRGVELILV